MGHGEGSEQGDDGTVLHAKTKMLNIFLLGLCFCFVFTGFNTMGQTQNLIYTGAANYTENFEVNGLVT